MAYRVFLSLGSNMGERQKYLSDAAGNLKGVPDTRVVWTSSVYETDPYGKQDQPQFLNAVVEIETALEPEKLLDVCKGIEQTLGRTSTEKWGPREIDIDILIYDGVVFGNSSLKVPHPELEKRKFVLVPLKEIAPDLIHPENGMTITELADACRDSSRVVRSYHRILL
jgi:2-amino-4-hydroxy-6-hydroxymethyldihydropteridine diphosphokinase